MAISLAALIAIIHVYVFVLESLLWGRAKTNRLFRVSEADAATLKKMAFNQGFYNLFLAISLLAGIFFVETGRDTVGHTLMDYGALSVLGAGLVLLFSDFSLKRPALIQALPAAAYFVARLI